MKNIVLITKREYLTQVKKKSFIILTLLAPLLMIGFGAFVAFMINANKSSYTIDVVDKSGLFAGKLKSEKDIKYIYVPAINENSLKSALKDMKGTDGLLIIPEVRNNNFENLEKSSKLLINTKIGFDTKQEIASKMSAVIKQEKIKQLGLNERDRKSVV